MRDFLPLLLNLKGKEVVIFGGGEVGERKAKLFCEHASVTAVSREFTPLLNSLKDKIKLIKVKDISEKEISRYLKDAFIAIPATNDALLNEKIAEIASQSGKLVNRVDDLGDIIVPSVIERGDIVIGISTLGKSPALSKFIRERIEGVITPEFALMSRLQNELREKLKIRVEDQKKRKEILWNILNDEKVWAALRESYDKAYMIALKHIENEND
ncbi:MAG: bifunctional precorrin-2 dehydrogenase/sirohydrochlorin ferrochelatase [Candidatus Methanoperedens sp.]|nr:bifunctional precorrin-2 dehydrogenase/sirohydrochlorin ferrochelatase [Candidatus Methanoperedens sp.]MCZ7395874.1 bifunctional precorrin-2 dehydrogenase/sirohydrochlorin ferrochelatase [Candidatus Methanoperedens sp.]